MKSEVCVCRGRECAGGKAQVLCSLCKGERAKRIKRQHPVLISLLPRDKKKEKRSPFSIVSLHLWYYMTHSWTWEEENPGRLRAQSWEHNGPGSSACIRTFVSSMERTHRLHAAFIWRKWSPKRFWEEKKYDLYMIHMWTTSSVIDLSTYNSAVQSTHIHQTILQMCI